MASAMRMKMRTRTSMNTKTSGRGGNHRALRVAESGFSLLEVMISMSILTVGLVSLLGVFGLAMAATQSSQQDMIAKQLADEALESIVTARNTSQLGWDDIQNQGSSCSSGSGTCGLFMIGSQPIYGAGADGIFGTADDSASGLQYLNEPGPDGIYGTSDDVQIPLTSFQRTILITPVTSGGVVSGTLRAVNITVQYQTAQTNLTKTYTLSSLISQYQ
jgi:prepilin-type N-terminal cleavage/methylation domain-containing protein